MKKDRIILSDEVYRQIAKDMLTFLETNGLSPEVSDILLKQMPHTFWEIHALALLTDIEIYLYNYLMVSRYDILDIYRSKINDLGRRGASYPMLAGLINGLPNNFVDINEMYDIYDPTSEL